MTLTKSQKIWLGLLGVGVAAFGVDQVMSGTDSTAAVAMAAVTHLVTGTAADAPVAEDAAVVTQSLAARMNAIAGVGVEDGRDPFATPVGWRPAEAKVEAPAIDAAAEFKRSHSLKGVFQSPGADRVLVDGQLLAVGQSIDGFKLLRVGRLCATFGRSATHVDLAMADANLQSRPEKQRKSR